MVVCVCANSERIEFVGRFTCSMELREKSATIECLDGTTLCFLFRQVKRDLQLKCNKIHSTLVCHVLVPCVCVCVNANCIYTSSSAYIDIQPVSERRERDREREKDWFQFPCIQIMFNDVRVCPSSFIICVCSVPTFDKYLLLNYTFGRSSIRIEPNRTTNDQAQIRKWCGFAHWFFRAKRNCHDHEWNRSSNVESKWIIMCAGTGSRRKKTCNHANRMQVVRSRNSWMNKQNINK